MYLRCLPQRFLVFHTALKNVPSAVAILSPRTTPGKSCFCWRFSWGEREWGGKLTSLYVRQKRQLRRLGNVLFFQRVNNIFSHDLQRKKISAKFCTQRFTPLK